MTILFAGDTHGNTSHVGYLYTRAAEHSVNAIFQVGDFGYWAHTRGGQHFLDEVSDKAIKNGIPLYWIDGNHENHDLLQDMVGITPVRPLIFYVPRGTMVELDGRQILGYGGAYSVDKRYRTEGLDWWPQETIDSEHVMQVAERFKDSAPDILACHDAPYAVNLDFAYAEGKNEFPQTRWNRKCLQHLVDEVKPKRVISGHYHTRFKGKLDDGTPIDILDRDTTKNKSWMMV